MSLISLELLVLVAVLVMTVVVILSVTVVVRGQGTEATQEQLAVARTTGRWRLAGAVIGVPVAWFAADQGALGRGLLLAAPLFGLCLLAGVVIGELRVRPPQGPERSATLQVRRVRSYLPRALTVAVGSAVGLLVGVLALTTLAGSPDDLGRPGRTLARRCTATTSEGSGPWPGSFYTLPLALLVAVGLLAAGFALVQVVRRPATSGDPAVDDELRRAAARSITAAAGLLISVPLAAVSGLAALMLAGFGCRPAWWDLPTVSGAVVALAALGLGVWCTAVLLVPNSVLLRSDRAPVRR